MSTKASRARAAKRKAARAAGAKETADAVDTKAAKAPKPAKTAPKRVYQPYLVPEITFGLSKDLNLFDRSPQEERFLNSIEDLLRLMHKRHDPEPIMRQVRATFPSPHTMLMADRLIWEKFGLRRNDAMLMSKLLDFYRFFTYKSFGDHPRIARLVDVTPFVLTIFLGRREEYIYLLCMNKVGRLKKLVLLHIGTEDGSLLSIGKLLHEVVRYSPSALILCHNHPGGTLRPSNDDVAVTARIIHSLRLMQVPLLDHLVVTNSTVVSLRDNEFIPESYWIGQNPDHYYLRNWLNPYPPGKKPKSSP